MLTKPITLLLEPDSAPPSGSAMLGGVTRGTASNLPILGEAARGQIMPNTQAEFDASAAISPQYAQLLTGLAQQFLPQLAQLGVDVGNIAQQGSAAGTGDTIRQNAPDLARLSREAEGILAPEAMAGRSQIANQLSQLLGSFNIGAPNIEAERLIGQESARRGTLGAPSATETVSNALQFGREQQGRQASLANAINTAAASMGALQPGVNFLGAAAGDRTVNPLAGSQFGGVVSPSGVGNQFAGGLLGAGTALEGQSQQIDASRRDTLDRFNETMSSLPSD